MPHRPALLLALLALATAFPLPARADEDAGEVVIYRWVDQNGITHYTTDRERIPASLRDRIPTVPAEPRSNPGEGWAVRDASEAGTPPPAPGLEPAPTDVEAGPDVAPAAAPAAAPRDPELAARIASLEAEIAAEEERLKAMISDPARADQAKLAEDAEFREVARRLPKLQADLRALREREGPQTGSSPPGAP